MGYTQGLSSVGGAGNKISKARSKVVKPVLKKLSHSARNSLDLDRGWDEQPAMVQWMGGNGPTYGEEEFSHSGTPLGAGKSARDVSFEIPGRSSLNLGREALGSRASAARKTSFQHHGRSLSGNSHHSVATNGSGGARVGSFVHPFQQLPRTSTSTPPLGYANSSTSFDNGTIASRDYSPTITEYEDDDGDGDVGGASASIADPRDVGPLGGPSPAGPFRLNSQQSYHNSSSAAPNPAPGKRRPSLGSQRASSLSDITSITSTTTPTLRGNKSGRTTPTISSSRLVPSKSDLHLNLDCSSDSPSSNPPVLKSTKTAPVASPTSSSMPMSPLRTSLDAIGIPRLRSHSEVDSAARQEQIRKARRKFEERERAKEEKYDREQVHKRDRRDTKEALKIEKKTQEWYKATGVSDSGVGIGLCGSSLNCSKANLSTSLAGSTILETPDSTSGRPSFSRKHTPTNLSSTFTVSGLGSNPSGGSKVFGKRKGSFPGVGSSQARSSSGLHDITTIRKSSGFDRGDYANNGDAEKQQSMFAGNSYDSVPDQTPPMFGKPAYDEDTFARPPQLPRMPSRKKQAKEKTQSTWHIFRMWFLAKVMRITRR